MATKRKDGRLQSSVTITDYFTGKKTRLYVYGYTEKEVEAERARVIEEAKRASLGRLSPSFEEWCKESLAERLANHEINDVTHESYETNIRTHILPNLPIGIKASDVKPYHIKNILKQIQGDRTRNYTYTILNKLFQDAMYEGIVSVNPCSYVKKPKYKSEPAKFLTQELLDELLEPVRGTQWQYIFEFALCTGCRRGEIAALRWSDLDEENRTVRVTTALKETKQKGVFEDATKSKYSVRTLVLPKEAMSSLLEWKKLLRRQLLQHRLPWYDDGYIFRKTSDLSQPIPPTTITTKMGELRRRLGLPPRTCMHSFRHTHATLLAEQEVGVKAIQVRMGHASAGFTMDTYVHNTAKMQDGAAEATSNIIGEYLKSKNA